MRPRSLASGGDRFAGRPGASRSRPRGGRSGGTSCGPRRTHGRAEGDSRRVSDGRRTDRPWVRARDPEVLSQIEAAFTVTRAALQQDDPRAPQDAARLMALLDRAAGARPAAARASVFWFALLVILREGFEAAIIVAALLAVLKKRKQLSLTRIVHVGWTSALAVGAVVFVLGRKVLAGAMDEKLEGCLAFVAVVMLLHAALWLNARSTTRKTMGELCEPTRGALDRGALGLFAIAFLAVFRESFETAVFLEALSIDAPSAVVWGSVRRCGRACRSRRRGRPPRPASTDANALQGVDVGLGRHVGRASRAGHPFVRRGRVDPVSSDGLAAGGAARNLP